LLIKQSLSFGTNLNKESKNMKEIIEKLKKQFKLSAEVFQKDGLAFLTAEKSDAVAVITHLKDYEGFTHLAFLTAADWLEDGYFQLTYMLHNYELNESLGIRVMLDRKNAEMSSIHHLWEQSRTYQRELNEMFGIYFPNSPGVDDSFILEGWHDKPPMQRDFDSKVYSDATYFPRPGRQTKDPRQQMQKNLYPDYKKFED